MSTIGHHLAEHILEAEEATHPWRYIIIRDALPAHDYDRLLARLPMETDKEITGRRFILVQEGDPILDAVESREVRLALIERCGFEGYHYARYNLDRLGGSCSVHPDTSNKRGTLQVYLTDHRVSGHGTKIWSRDRRKQCAEVPFEMNVGYAFKRESFTMHSFGPLHGDRWSLLVPFMKVPV